MPWNWADAGDRHLVTTKPTTALILMLCDFSAQDKDARPAQTVTIGPFDVTISWRVRADRHSAGGVMGCGTRSSRIAL